MEQRILRPHELLRTKNIPVPRYDPARQITISPEPQKEFAQRALHTIEEERTRAAREIQSQTGFPFRDTGGIGLEWAIGQTNQAVGRRFQVHGIAKGDIVADLNNIRENGIDKHRTLYSMPFIEAKEALEAFGADRPKTEGGIYLISACDQKLTESGIQFIGVGEEYMDVVDLLQQLWKDKEVRVVPWHDLPRLLTQVSNTTADKDGHVTTYPLPEEGNPPSYASKEAFQPLLNPNPSNANSEETSEPGDTPSASSAGDDVW